MTPPYQSSLINTAAACRAKAEALRQEALLQSATVSAAKLLEIAEHWDHLAADYDRTDEKWEMGSRAAE